MKKMVLITVLCGLAASCIFALYVVFTRQFETIEINILWTIATLTFYSLVGMIAAAHMKVSRTKWLGLLGIGFCIIAGLFAVVTTWTGERFDHIGIRWRCFLIGLALAHACIMLSLKPRSIWVRVLIGVAIVAAVVDTIIAVVIDRAYWDDNYILIMVIAIIGVFATIAAPLVNNFYEEAEKEKAKENLG